MVGGTHNKLFILTLTLEHRKFHFIAPTCARFNMLAREPLFFLCRMRRLCILNISPTSVVRHMPDPLSRMERCCHACSSIFSSENYIRYIKHLSVDFPSCSILQWKFYIHAGNMKGIFLLSYDNNIHLERQASPQRHTNTL